MGKENRFAEKCPGERFALVESDSVGVVDTIADHKADVGFTGTVLALIPQNYPNSRKGR